MWYVCGLGNDSLILCQLKQLAGREPELWLRHPRTCLGFQAQAEKALLSTLGYLASDRPGHLFEPIVTLKWQM